MYTARNIFSSTGKSGVIDTTGANALMFVNEGNCVFKVNNLVTVKPGDTFSISQVQYDVIDETIYNISFYPNHPDSTGTDQLCVFVKIGVYKQKC